MTRSIVAVTAAACVALLAAACGTSGSLTSAGKSPAAGVSAAASSPPAPGNQGSPAASPSSSDPPDDPVTNTCVTSTEQGECGPYSSYPLMVGITSPAKVGNDVWSPIQGWHQTLNAVSPGNWQVTANMPAGNTAVVSYPSIGAGFGTETGQPTPLSDYSSIYSSFTEAMHATSKTSAWAAYDIWLGTGHSTSASNEVMIQHDFAGNGPCTAVARATFGGSGGVPVQKWYLCKFGSELIWKLTGSEHTGSINMLAMLTWLENHGFLPQHSGLLLAGYGWEICSTGGIQEKFNITHFSLVASRKAS
jgi:hypothetical protein